MRPDHADACAGRAAVQTPGQLALTEAVEGLGGMETLRSLVAADADGGVEFPAGGNWPPAVVKWGAEHGAPHVAGLSAALALTAEALPVSLDASGWRGTQDIVPDNRAVLL